MQKKSMMFVVLPVVLVLVGGGFALYSNASNDSGPSTAPTASTASVKPSEHPAPAPSSSPAASPDPAENTSEVTTAKNPGRYVDLADYEAEPSAYADTTVVYFFHATWCSICKGIDDEITSDVNQIPENVTIVKTDFDDSLELRKKFGVTTQYTFVQVDGSGNEVGQWSATSFEDALNGIGA